MSAFLFYPFYIIVFWYKDVLGSLIEFFVMLNKYTVALLSLSLLIKSFFKPLKNEYRKGLVFFSIVAGVIIKLFLISISLSIILIILLVEFLVLVFLFLLPLLLLLLVLGKKI